MFQHHRLTRLLSMLLLLSIVLSILPGNLLVQAVSEISSVEISGATAPVSDSAPDYHVSVPGSAQYAVESVSWIQQDTGSAMYPADTFEAGKQYQIRIILTVTADAVFKLDEIGNHMVTATIDGQAASCTVATGKDTAEYLCVTYQYTAKDSSISLISRVAVTALNVPISGAAPDNTASAADQSYSVNSIVWTHLNPAGGSAVTMTSADRFLPGGKYRVQVILKAASGYAFSGTVSGTLNGTAATCQSVANQDAGQYISLVCEYALSGGNQITHADITGLTVPMKGGKPDLTATIASNALYTVNSVEWKYWKSSEESTSAVPMSAQSTFQMGYNYQVTAILKAKNGSTFATDSSGSPLVTGTINGDPSLPGTAVAGRNPSQYVGISYVFALDAKLIENVVITGVIDPIVSSRPNAIANVSKDSPYTVSEITWELFDDTYPPGEYVRMNSYSIFAAGIRYRINITLKAADGAEFNLDDAGAPAVSGKINDYAAQSVEAIPGRDPSQYVCVRYEYPILTEKILQVEVFDVDEPVVDAKPDDEVEVPEDALYIVEKITWEKLDTSVSPAKYVKMSASEKFEANHDYRVTFLLKAKEGGAFFVNDFGMLQVTAQVNGKATIPAEAVEDAEPTEFVTIGYDFSLTSDAQLIKRTPLYELEIPAVGQTPDFDIQTDQLAKYTFVEAVWERLANRQSSAAVAVMGENDTFEEGHFYRVTITLKAKDDARFQTNEMGRPQVTVTLNNGAGIAAERVVGENPEEYICVSYVYGVYTVIDGGGAAWSPGKAPLKFRFTGDFKNFSEVWVKSEASGKEEKLDPELYTASEGSTIIILSQEYLNTLLDGTYELTIVYTDGQASTQFTVSDHNNIGGQEEKGLSPWLWLLPLAVIVLGVLFVVVFIWKRKLEARVYEEEYEEYDEDEEA